MKNAEQKSSPQLFIQLTILAYKPVQPEPEYWNWLKNWAPWLHLWEWSTKAPTWVFLDYIYRKTMSEEELKKHKRIFFSPSGDVSQNLLPCLQWWVTLPIHIQIQTSHLMSLSGIIKMENFPPPLFWGGHNFRHRWLVPHPLTPQWAPPVTSPLWWQLWLLSWDFSEVRKALSCINSKVYCLGKTTKKKLCQIRLS